jgi:hypothetical protein
LELAGPLPRLGNIWHFCPFAMHLHTHAPSHRHRPCTFLASSSSILAGVAAFHLPHTHAPSRHRTRVFLPPHHTSSLRPHSTTSRHQPPSLLRLVRSVHLFIHRYSSLVDHLTRFLAFRLSMPPLAARRFPPRHALSASSLVDHHSHTCLPAFHVSTLPLAACPVDWIPTSPPLMSPAFPHGDCAWQ